MNWNYEAWLANKLNSLVLELGLKIKPKVFSEREFLRKTELAPDEVGVVTRRSQSELTYGAETLPVQILVMSEANSSEESALLFNTFSERFNFSTDPSQGEVICKHQYSAPVTMTNFDSVSYGYRSVLYVNGTLVLVGGVYDVRRISIDDEELEIVDFSISYQMQTNTQTKATDQLATSVKTAATLAIAFTMPLAQTEFVSNVLRVIGGSEDGNEPFDVDFFVGNQEIYGDFKLISAQIDTSRNSVPSLRIGMSR